MGKTRDSRVSAGCTDFSNRHPVPLRLSALGGVTARPSAITRACSRRSHTATTNSDFGIVRALARWTASAPRSACCPASSPARRSTVAVSSTGRIAAQNSFYELSASVTPLRSRELFRPAAAIAARTSGYARRLDNAASQPSQRCSQLTPSFLDQELYERAAVEIDDRHRLTAGE